MSNFGHDIFGVKYFPHALHSKHFYSRYNIIVKTILFYLFMLCVKKTFRVTERRPDNGARETIKEFAQV